MADKKVSELDALTNLSGDDLLLVVNDPAGSPTSRKVTLSNFFANVSVDTVHNGRLTVQGNTALRGTVVTVSANVIMSGDLDVSADLTVNNYNVGSTLDVLDRTKMAVSNTVTLVNDRLQVANAAVLYATIAQVEDRLQVANAAATYATKTEVNTKLQVANAAATYQTIAIERAALANTNAQLLDTNARINTIIDDLTGAEININTIDFTSNTVSIQANTGLNVSVGSAPSSNSPTTEGWTAGTIAFSNNYLYIAVDGNTIKRVSLEVF